MRKHWKKGLAFGLTSGIITTLGLMVGLGSSTSSRLAVMGGIITIALADALSDAAGVHVSEEAEEEHTPKEIWECTLLTFLSKFIFAISFIFPLLFLPLQTAVWINVIYGFILVIFFNLYFWRSFEERYKITLEHFLIAIVVIVVSYYLGEWVSMTFS